MVAQEKKFSMLNFIKEICDDIGPRLGTTENEKKAGLRIKDILEKQVDKVEMEDFTCHPKGFLEFTKVAWFSGLIGFLLFLWLPLISMLLCFYAITTFVFEFLMGKEYVDFMFPKKTGTNVIGKVNPEKEAKKIVIISGHHDSAYEFPLFEKFKHNFDKLAYATAGLLLFSAISGLVKFILDILGISNLVTNIILISIPLVAIIIGGYVAFGLHSKKVILGANDNLSGVAVVLALAHHFSSQKLNNIELWLISFSCEECMRGSKRFVKRHLEELKDSYTINYDMVGRGAGGLAIISAEPAYLVKHDMDLALEFQKSSKNASNELPIEVLGFGGSDAACFSKKGLKAISIFGLTPENYPDTWHELADTPEFIEEDKLEATKKITIQFLKDLDASL